jgi:hypothetical protein
MQKRKYYHDVRFPGAVIEEAHSLFISYLAEGKKAEAPDDLSVSIGDEKWRFDSLEEFLADYPKGTEFRLDHMAEGSRMIVEQPYGSSISVLVEFPTRVRIEAVFAVFERNLDRSRIVVPAVPLRVFIGHGRDPQWRDLKDHLQDHHELDVVAYEIGPRAGMSVKEVLERMLDRSSFAVLVLTGEDIHADGELHARENVIHELGLFQGRIGFTRAIALLEEGTREFSNILGINQLRFRQGSIRETFGDVLATIRREFPNQTRR